MLHFKEEQRSPLLDKHHDVRKCSSERRQAYLAVYKSLLRRGERSRALQFIKYLSGR